MRTQRVFFIVRKLFAILLRTTYMKHPFELPALPYDASALEPHIDALTMETHHGKHHATYVAKLNEAVSKHPEIFDVSLESMLADLSTVPEDIRTAVRNHGGGHLNHSLFWTMMGPNKGGDPQGDLAQSISSTWGDLAAFRGEFETKATTLFGSGWVWLVKDSAGALKIIQTSNQDSPISVGLTPILAVDVWEHAYYLKYRQARVDYVKAWWNVVDWNAAQERFIK
jgi:Fe-Mn family superoxide dismutase